MLLLQRMLSLWAMLLLLMIQLLLRELSLLRMQLRMRCGGAAESAVAADAADDGSEDTVVAAIGDEYCYSSVL